MQKKEYIEMKPRGSGKTLGSSLYGENVGEVPPTRKQRRMMQRQQQKQQEKFSREQKKMARKLGFM